MNKLIREFRRHGNYVYYAIRTILRLDILPVWAVGRGARVCCLFVLGGLFVAYIAITSVASASGYKMKDLEKEVASLKKEIQKTEVRIAEYDSMGSLEERIKNIGLVAVSDIQYVNTDQPTVAKR